MDDNKKELNNNEVEKVSGGTNNRPIIKFKPVNLIDSKKIHVYYGAPFPSRPISISLGEHIRKDKEEHNDKIEKEKLPKE